MSHHLASGRVPRRSAAHGRDAGSRRGGLAVRALAVYAVYAGLAWWSTSSWWTPLGGRITAVNSADATLFSWLLTWTPHAVGAGTNPLFSAAMNAPTGINLMWNNGMPLPALLLAPVTAALGGVATVTVLVALGLAGTAATAFACLRSWGVATLPAALGGGLFGFSPAMTAQSLGHPNLVFLVLAPVLVHLAVRLALRPRRRTAVLLGLAAGAQVLIGEEVLFLCGVTVAVLLVVLAATHPRAAVRGAPRFGAHAALALGVFVLVGAAPLAYQLAGPLRQTGSPFSVAYFGVDLADVVTPTSLQLLSADGVYPAGLEELTGFLGWPLVVVVGLALVAFARVERVRTPLVAALLLVVFGMGQRLRIEGTDTGIPLPWAALAGLPGFEHVIANRMALLAAGLLGAALAFALDAVREREWPWRATVTAAVVVALLPLLPAPLPGADVGPVPGWFTSAAARACPGGSVLVLPYPSFFDPDPMRWQAASGMAFAMPGGYFIGPGDDGHAYVGGQPSATGSLFAQVQDDGQVRPVTPEMREAFTADLHRWNACAAVLGPSRNLDAVRGQMEALVGRAPDSGDGVLVWNGLG